MLDKIIGQLRHLDMDLNINRILESSTLSGSMNLRKSMEVYSKVRQDCLGMLDILRSITSGVGKSDLQFYDTLNGTCVIVTSIIDRMTDGISVLNLQENVNKVELANQTDNATSSLIRTVCDPLYGLLRSKCMTNLPNSLSSRIYNLRISFLSTTPDPLPDESFLSVEGDKLVFNSLAKTRIMMIMGDIKGIASDKSIQFLCRDM
ncbi:hypothetical protein C3H57_04110 [Campylobacter jejuni]|uniref:Uncharacterized protein n=1 Tax=Campylobacter jejuni TaxID=197 RepID=A0A431EE68_CAMJU|nr:hypothetical protein C3H57_04110 [Campylobacter jejuni]